MITEKFLNTNQSVSLKVCVLHNYSFVIPTEVLSGGEWGGVLGREEEFLGLSKQVGYAANNLK